MVIHHINPVGKAIVEVFSATSRCQSRDAGGRSRVATHLGHRGTWVLVDPDLADVNLLVPRVVHPCDTFEDQRSFFLTVRPTSTSNQNNG